jgi:hypothetical protein
MRGDATPGRLRWAALVSVGAALLSVAAPSQALGSDQFTLDKQPDSYGAIVTDAAGNGYVAWNHEANIGTDVPMFCKLAPATQRCTDPITLALPGGPTYASDDQPFPVLGPSNTVWVVASRYIADDTVIWTSTNGGQSFSAPYDIPYIPTCPLAGPCSLSFSFAGLTNVDDMLPVTPSYAAYDGQLYKTSSGQPDVYWLESSNNPGLGFNIDNTNETLGGPAGASEFSFEGTGGGGVAGSALGLTASGEVVEAYWLESSTPTLAYYYFRAANPDPISPQTGWNGPVVVGHGQLPRLADGADGLFMLSEDSVNTSQPTAVDVRKYNPATHLFGAPLTLADNPANTPDPFGGGGLAENYETGELAAVWPQFDEGGASLMRLYLSTDGGTRFSPAQYVATVGSSYLAMDNARVAIADDGTGFVTFRDGGGLEVSDLNPIAAQYKALHSNSKFVYLAVTCPAPKSPCKGSASIGRPPGTAKGIVAKGKFSVPAGATVTVKLRLSGHGTKLLNSRHGRLTATLTLLLALPGAATHTTTAHVEIREGK